MGCYMDSTGVSRHLLLLRDAPHRKGVNRNEEGYPSYHVQDDHYLPLR